MNPPQLFAERNLNRARHLLWGLPVILAGVFIWFATQSPLTPAIQDPSVDVVEVPRAQLELRSTRLHRIGATNTFNGWMVEHYPDGALRSRSSISNGLLHGISQGWHTNGQLQVVEHFRHGVSHGVRTKWNREGVKLSEGEIVDGEFDGVFRRWSESGFLVDQIQFVAGQPDGEALTFFESGFIKARTRMRSGKIVEQKFWNDRERQDASSLD